MEYQIIQIDEQTWCIEDAGVRFFLLTGTKEALLIDSGMQVHNAKEIAQTLTDLPIKLLITHADPDHIGSNAEFDEFFMNPAESCNYYKTQNRTGSFVSIENGDVLDIGERPLEIISMAGHTPGSIAVLDIKNRMLFSGDPIQDGNIFMFGAQREFNAYKASLEKILDIKYTFDEIYPSHGTAPITADIIPALIKGAEEILAGTAQLTDYEMFGKKVHKYDAGVATFLVD